jgi:hypothetical protein
MEFGSIAFGIGIALMGIFVPFFFVDLHRLKKIKSKLNRGNFLERLKSQLLFEVIRDKKTFFFMAVFFFAILLLLLAIESPLADNQYEKIYNHENIVNKTIEEKENLATIYSSNMERMVTTFYTFSLFIAFTLFVIYFYWKFNKHMNIEESLSKRSLSALLTTLGVKEMDVKFYKAIEEKFGRMRKKDIYESMATFIYDTIEYKGKKRIK